MVSDVNKTYGKSIFRTIKSSLSRFVALLAIVALGVGFLAGLLSSPVDMRHSADHYYDQTRMYDARIISTLGLTEDDLATVKAVDGVEAVMPAYDTDLVLVTSQEDSASYTTRMHSLPEDTSADSEGYLNQLTLIEGRMPEEAGECVIVLTKSFSGDTEWIGQTLRQDPDGEAAEGLPDEFTVVGTVRSAAYLSMESESTTAGSGTLTYADLCTLWGKFEDYEMNVLLCNPEVGNKILSLEELRQLGDGNRFTAPGTYATPFGALLLKSSAVPADTVIALDKNCALEMVTAGGVGVEYDKVIDCQTERVGITCITGFAKLYPDAVKVLKIKE